MSVVSLPAVLFLLVSLTCVHCQQRFLQQADAEEDGNKASDGDEESQAPKKPKRPLSDDELHAAHKEFDENHDEEATRQEMVNFAGAHQREVDELDGQSAKTWLNERDTSKDGLLSLEEHMGQGSNLAEVLVSGSETDKQNAQYELEKFQAADTNGDGQLDKDEIPALISPRTHAKMVEVEVNHHMRDTDADKNGKIEFGEFEKSQILDDYDAQGSVLSTSESGKAVLRTGEGALVQLTEDEIADREKIKAEGGLDIDMRQKTYDTKIITKRLFKRLDVNGDGSLAADELKPWATGQVQHEDVVDSLIDTLDKDGDKTVDRMELLSGKTPVTDSAIQDYLIEWAKHRQMPGR